MPTQGEVVCVAQALLLTPAGWMLTVIPFGFYAPHLNTKGEKFSVAEIMLRLLLHRKHHEGKQFQI